MSKLKIPSLQHLARNWRDDPIKVKRVLVRLAKNAPDFNYNPLFAATRDMLIFGHHYEDIVEGIRRGIKREHVKQNFLEVLPLLWNYFDGLNPDFVQSIEPRYYPVGRELMVPFRPPLIYGKNGQIHFPWLSFWRRNPLAGRQLSLFVTVVEEILSQDPDLEGANFKILDFSAARPKEPRTLSVIDAKDVARVSDEQKREMLWVFAEGFRLAEAELANSYSSSRGDSRRQNDRPGDAVDKSIQPRLL